MTPTIDAYGFGSHFPSGKGRDVDILLVHDDLTRESVEFAIQAKRLLMTRMPMIDVVLLSRIEEREHDFLHSSAGAFLQRLYSGTLSADIDALIARIPKPTPS